MPENGGRFPEYKAGQYIALGRNAPAYELARLAVDRVAQVFGADSPNLIGATMALCGCPDLAAIGPDLIA